jgi:hypothetical protein
MRIGELLWRAGAFGFQWHWRKADVNLLESPYDNVGRE